MLNANKLKLLTFNTGLYTSRSFDIVNEVLVKDGEENLTNSKTTLFGKKWNSLTGYYNRDFYFMKYFNKTKFETIVGLSDIGEITFSYISFIKSTKPVTNKKFVEKLELFKNILDYTESSRLYGTCGADVKDGIDIMIRHFSKKLTKEDYESDLYRKYIGYPLDPFKQELFKDARQDLMNSYETYIVTKGLTTDIDIPIPNDFEIFETNKSIRFEHWIASIFEEKFKNFIGFIA